jgi:hypothetical protein
MFWRRKAAAHSATSDDAKSASPVAADPLLAAAQYVAIVSGGGRPSVFVTRIYDPILCTSPAGEGVCFLLESNEGASGKMYFFSGFASAWPDGEAAPRPQIPTEMIASRVPSYAETLQSLMVMIPRGVDRVARVTN